MTRTTALLAGMLLAAGGAMAQSHARKADSPDIREIRDFRLNMDIVQRYVQAVKLVTGDAGAKKCVGDNSPGNASTLDAGEKLLHDCPAAVADLRTAGIRPREFLIVTAALIGDVMAVELKKNGTIKAYPDSISPENAAFVEQNFDKLQAMLAAVSGDRK